MSGAGKSKAPSAAAYSTGTVTSSASPPYRCWWCLPRRSATAREKLCRTILATAWATGSLWKSSWLSRFREPGTASSRASYAMSDGNGVAPYVRDCRLPEIASGEFRADFGRRGQGDAGGDPPAWSGRRRPVALRRQSLLARPPAPCHHRPAYRRPADVQRGRDDLDRLQRRNLQLR